MAYIDIFNGDADGLCALLQLHNHSPRKSSLVTGVKRDIQLLSRVEVTAGDQLTVLDISLDKNRDALTDVLDRGAQVFYVDHHYAGDVPEHPSLEVLIDTSADVCTSVLVNGHLRGEFAEWAVVGAFGDNLEDSAIRLARPLGLTQEQIESARELGTYLNYNGYGASVEDLHFRPDELFELLRPHRSPFGFLNESRRVFDRLATGYREDMSRAAGVRPHLERDGAAAFILPDSAWARRVSGVFGNQLARQNPSRAHTILTECVDQIYMVSVRAPLNEMRGADELCRQFPTGGGRTAAAGINALPGERLDEFLEAFLSTFRAE